MHISVDVRFIFLSLSLGPHIFTFPATDSTVQTLQTLPVAALARRGAPVQLGTGTGGVTGQLGTSTTCENGPTCQILAVTQGHRGVSGGMCVV